MDGTKLTASLHPLHRTLLPLLPQEKATTARVGLVEETVLRIRSLSGSPNHEGLATGSYEMGRRAGSSSFIRPAVDVYSMRKLHET